MLNNSKIGDLLARLMALFFLAFLLFGATLMLVMPRLSEWAWSSCPDSESIACVVSLFLIAYWYLLAVPVVIAMTWLLHRILPGRNSSSRRS